jgi:hypothetical protein
MGVIGVPGFESKADHVLGYNIIVVPHLRFKVLKDALAYLGPYQTLTKVWYSDPGGQNTVSLPATIQIKKIPIQIGFVW